MTLNQFFPFAFVLVTRLDVSYYFIILITGICVRIICRVYDDDVRTGVGLGVPGELSTNFTIATGIHGLSIDNNCAFVQKITEQEGDPSRIRLS